MHKWSFRGISFSKVTNITYSEISEHLHRNTNIGVMPFKLSVDNPFGVPITIFHSRFDVGTLLFL